MTESEPLLIVRDLSVAVEIGGQPVDVVRSMEFTLAKGKTLCLVGESGCGKSVTALALLGLLPRHARISGGSVLFDGTEIAGLAEARMRAIRGRRIGIVFQEPMTSLNPTMTVGTQISEGLRLHNGLTAHQARRRAVELMEMVRIPGAAARLDDYPHMFSGGMRQRVMIALALACAPDLLIADEPTTALDVTVQAEILDLLQELQRETGTALLMITHDLGVVAEIADEVAVMYAGSIAERGPAGRFFDRPAHPYSIGLLGALPSGAPGRRLTPIRGQVPAPDDAMAGCRFAPRCPFSSGRCETPPPLEQRAGGGAVACWHAPLELAS